MKYLVCYVMTENKSKKPVWNKQDEQRYNALYTKLKDEFKDLNKDNYTEKNKQKETTTVY